MGKIRALEISFPTPIELPDGFDQTLSALVEMACRKYEEENPTRVMWPAGHGDKPIYNEPNEPTFDDAVYHIEVAEREDFYGSNPHNPDRDKLQAEYLAAKLERAEKKVIQ